MNRLVKTVRRGALGLVAALLLSSCGGGDPVVAFQPRRLLAFGDETSVLTNEGRKHTVNALKSDEVTLDCAANPLWIQRLASYYGLVLPQCNPDAVPDPASRVYAAPGATVAGLAAQVQAHIDAGSGFSATDLVTMMIGQHDILAQYALYDGSNKAALLAELRRRGELYAAQVSRVAALGGKVLASTPPDLSYTPFSIAEEANVAGRRVLIRELTDKFIEGMRAGLENESGSRVALMLGNELVRTMGRSVSEGFGGSYGLSDSTTAACDPVLALTVDQCTIKTLVTNATSTNHLWADDLQLSPAGHAYLGSLAVSRTTGNPF